MLIFTSKLFRKQNNKYIIKKKSRIINTTKVSIKINTTIYGGEFTKISQKEHKDIFN